jgi:hypothetical protein
MSEERPAGSDVLVPFRAADPAYKLSSRVTRGDPRWQSPDALLDAALGATSPDDPTLRTAASRHAPPLTLLAALARADLAAGRTAEAEALISRATARDANHLHLQALQRRAAGTGEPPGLAHRFCAAPFENLETNPGGAVYFCCPAWLPVPIGNLEEADAASIWNSRAAQDIRASIHDGTYRYCSRTHCPKLSRATLPKRRRSPRHPCGRLSRRGLCGSPRDRSTSSFLMTDPATCPVHHVARA